MNVSVYSSFHQLPSDLLRLNQFPRQQRFFLSHDWFLHLHRTVLQQQLSPRIYLVTGDDQELAAALYCARPPGTRKLISLTNYYSLEFSIVTFCDEQLIAIAADCLVKFIADERPRWQTVELRYLNSGDPTNESLAQALKKHHFTLNRFDQYENWYHPMAAEEYGVYLEHRPSQLRNTLKRKYRKLSKDYKFQIKIYPGDDPDLSHSILDYEKVYKASWKQNEPYPEFIPGLIELCARLDILILGVLYIDAEPVAAQLWLSLPGRFVIYKLAYDKSFDQLSVGTVLSDALFQYAYNINKRAEIDYGVGNETYKKQWMTRMRHVFGLEGFNRKTLVGLFFLLRYQAVTLLKSLSKRST